MSNMNSWQNLSLVILSTVAVVADAGLEIPDAFDRTTSSIETDSMHRGKWQPVPHYSYWIPPLPEPNVSRVGVVAVVAVAVRLDWSL